MMDQFREEVAGKRNQGMQTAIYLLVNVSWIVFALLAFLSFQLVTRIFMETRFSTAFLVSLLEFLLLSDLLVLDIPLRNLFVLSFFDLVETFKFLLELFNLLCAELFSIFR